MTNDSKISLEVIDIHKDYAGRPLLDGVSLDARQGETLCLLGESGSGKSTLLRIIAGLETPEAGRIFWRGEDVSQVPVHLRGFGLMFQDYALFPHLNVYENVAFGLRMQKLVEAELRQRANEALAQVHLEDFTHRSVRELSGGEQQRVALARTIASRPRLIMLDEPLGALDRTLKTELLAEIRALLRATRVPAIYVTHDQEEAFSLADRILILHGGRIIQGGTPAQVYRRPVDAWVARFLGQTNLVAGKVITTTPLVIRTPLGDLSSAEPPCADRSVGDEVTVLLRAAGFEEGASRSPNRLAGVVEDSRFQGNDYKVTLRCDGRIRLAFHTAETFTISEPVQFSIKPEDVLCLSKPQGMRL
ncbi:MAG: ABC transporter ATP-binding protein [Anaerolineae bacterium]|jgi:ABC-type Fe3+/spermidine/putrescine transport system ATPase subunit|nr:ABC transporter ATP-binding protein [Anaerolineae bacterium]